MNKFNMLLADKKGKIFDVPNMEACGMKAGCFLRLQEHDLIKLPSGSKLYMLPKRAPVGYDSKAKTFKTIDESYPTRMAAA